MAESKLGAFTLAPLGDGVLLIELGRDASDSTAERVHAVAEHLLQQVPAGVRDVVPAVCTVALHYDPLLLEQRSEGVTAYETLAQQVTERLASLDPAGRRAGAEVEIPVCYGGTFGEDLAALAEARGLSTEEAIALHGAPLYRVQMLGFAPGFAYLAGLDPRLSTPRRSTPRTRVPGGSVAIGGELTAVYPLDLPGGWHLIGRSPVRFFDPAAEQPSLLAAGDRVRFVRVSADQYTALEKGASWR
jgi:KipI family sensor histidine kinase inhibitor